MVTAIPDTDRAGVGGAAPFTRIDRAPINAAELVLLRQTDYRRYRQTADTACMGTHERTDIPRVR